VQRMASLHPARYFSTDHLYLAAYLVCTGHQITGTEPGNHNRILFTFIDSAELRSAASDFLSGGQVDARRFSFTILRLKKLIPRYTTMKKGSSQCTGSNT